MSTSTMPPSIQVWPDESGRLAHDGLDYGYIDGVARYVAESLANGLTVEACFQPGDMTRYNLIFVPLVDLATAPPRVKNQEPWEQHAIPGIRRNRDTTDATSARRYYPDAGTLVQWIDFGALVLDLSATPGYTSDYTAQKFNTTITSGCTLAILLRAITWHLAHPVTGHSVLA